MKGRLLYISPEFNLRFFLDRQDLEVRTSEYAKEAATDFHFDLIKIDCPDHTWDYIICHHVIEHVSDDRKALQELFRILKSGGTLILSVPIDPSLERTIEYGRPNPHETDHYYRYGRDFQSRIPREFQVVPHDFRSLFSEREFLQYHLKDDYLFVCRKPTACC
jgi:SAM-dependent methyltransferase